MRRKFILQQIHEDFTNWLPHYLPLCYWDDAPHPLHSAVSTTPNGWCGETRDDRLSEHIAESEIERAARDAMDRLGCYTNETPQHTRVIFVQGPGLLCAGPTRLARLHAALKQVHQAGGFKR